MQRVPCLLSVFQTSGRSHYFGIVEPVQLQGRWLRSTVSKRGFRGLRTLKFCQIGRNAKSGSVIPTKLGLSVEPSRTSNTCFFYRDKTTPVFEHQLRKLSGLVPSTLGAVLKADVAGFPPSVFDALLVPPCPVGLLLRVQLSRIHRPPGACRTGFYLFSLSRSARSYISAA